MPFHHQGDEDRAARRADAALMPPRCRVCHEPLTVEETAEARRRNAPFGITRCNECRAAQRNYVPVIAAERQTA